ncbi:hypothetical protein HPB52_014096 [Rhipicephalus sanguineus]|uniref:Uncharacterized protein n=1 Tax=Rhipicephalus sanguineus TaxID=34632 RepID=A0A9D4PFP7_RHISA|nr:hypothetical protein HPB52_014096 [Rhipicephalus sanguineus]
MEVEPSGTMDQKNCGLTKPLPLGSIKADCVTSRSGTEEEYEEKEGLLQEICSLAKDFAYKVKSRKAQSSAGQRVSAALTRDTAAATLVPASQVAFGT